MAITVQPRRSLEQQVRSLMQDYGAFTPLTINGYGATCQNVRGTVLFKAYLAIDSAGRRQREAHAVRQARHLGVSTPEVLSSGQAAGTHWTLFSVVPGDSRPLGDHHDAARFLRMYARVLEHIHTQPAPAAGPGWTGIGQSTARFVLSQLTPRWTRQTWARDLHSALRATEQQPCVLLHGDIQPRHFLHTSDQISVVDWETASRGPVGLDHADAVFHAVRDLAYQGGLDPDPSAISAALDRVTGGIPFLAWRLVLWADRRRPEDLSLFPAHLLRRLLASRTADEAVATTRRIIATMRDAGTPP